MSLPAWEILTSAARALDEGLFPAWKLAPVETDYCGTVLHGQFCVMSLPAWEIRTSAARALGEVFFSA